MDGFSESEVLQLYAEAFPADRKAARGQRLRERQLELLQHLQSLAAETPQAGDLVAGWFDEALAAKLVTAGILTLGALNTRISAGGRWFSSLPAVGIAKAHRIEHHLATLLPREVQMPKPLFALSATPALFDAPLPPRTSRASRADGTPVGRASADHILDAVTQVTQVTQIGQITPDASACPLLNVRTDQQAVQSWIQARAGSTATVKVYQREAHRLLLWLQYERHGTTLARMSVADCTAFMAFLQNIPPRWI